MKDEDGSFRLFLGDVGVFSYQSGINAASFVSNDRENTLLGIFFENFVTAELIAKGNPLFYWRGKASCELEFIIESDNKLRRGEVFSTPLKISLTIIRMHVPLRSPREITDTTKTRGF